MKPQRILIFLLSIACTTVANAADEKGKFTIKGIGNTSCAKFLMETDANTKSVYLYVGWVNGYLTAQNQHLKDNFDLASWENVHTLGDYLRHYCKKRPRDSFYIATASMVQGLHKDRVREYSKVVTINSGQESIVIYQSTLKKVQEKLTKLGLYKDNINGTFEKSMSKSLKVFQKNNKLDITGIPDQQTLHAFFRK